MKDNVESGDIIHIYHMFGESEYRDTEGIVHFIDDLNQIHGSWGSMPLHFDDDWEIIG